MTDRTNTRSVNAQGFKTLLLNRCSMERIIFLFLTITINYLLLYKTIFYFYSLHFLYKITSDLLRYIAA